MQQPIHTASMQSGVPNANLAYISNGHSDRKPSSSRRSCCMCSLKLLMAVATLGLVAFVVMSSTDHKRVNEVLTWITEHRRSGFLIFLAIYIVCTVAFVPVTLLAVAAGAIFGLYEGATLVWLGAMVGETAAFLLGRFLLRDMVSGIASKHKMWHVVEIALREEGWKVVLLLRMAPILPFAVLNYALGSTAVPFGPFFLASSVGIIPAVLLHTYLGSLLPSVSSIEDGTGASRTTRIALLVFSVASCVVVLIVTSIVSRRALLRHLAALEQSEHLEPLQGDSQPVSPASVYYPAHSRTNSQSSLPSTSELDQCEDGSGIV